MIHTIIFDLGNVLIGWNPRLLYRKVFDSHEKADWFVDNIVTLDWNEEQDRGRPIAQATELLVAQYPEWEKEIRIYYDRWTESFSGPIPGTVDILKQLAATTREKSALATKIEVATRPDGLVGSRPIRAHPCRSKVSSFDSKERTYKLLALTNWSAELFPWARESFDFLSLFEDIIVSGEVKMKKPEPPIYLHLRDKHQLGDFSGCVFIDDSARNVAAAQKLGLDSIHFQNPPQLAQALQQRGIEL